MCETGLQKQQKSLPAEKKLILAKDFWSWYDHWITWNWPISKIKMDVYVYAKYSI